jgi:ribitol 2-dehydrogenase
MSSSLDGKTAIVTGASSGIGRATAIRLSAEGVKLSLVARSTDAMKQLARELPNEAHVVTSDLAGGREADRIVDESARLLGHIDILFANAGVFIPGEVVEGDPDAWDRMIALNVNAVLRSVRRVLPHMIGRGSGDIIVTSSISGHQAIHWEPVYSATKHAIQSFIHGLRRQVAPKGIRVGEIAPGIVLNNIWGYSDPEKIAAKVAEHAGITSEDVADAVIYMLTRPPHVTIRDLVILPQNQDI